MRLKNTASEQVDCELWRVDVILCVRKPQYLVQINQAHVGLYIMMVQQFRW